MWVLLTLKIERNIHQQKDKEIDKNSKEREKKIGNEPNQGSSQSFIKKMIFGARLLMSWLLKCVEKSIKTFSNKLVSFAVDDLHVTTNQTKMYQMRYWTTSLQIILRFPLVQQNRKKKRKKKKDIGRLPSQPSKEKNKSKDGIELAHFRFRLTLTLGSEL